MIFNTLINQAIYTFKNGDLSLSTDENERSKAYDDVALSELNTDLYEIGCSILYTGVWRNV